MGSGVRPEVHLQEAPPQAAPQRMENGKEAGPEINEMKRSSMIQPIFPESRSLSSAKHRECGRDFRKCSIVDWSSLHLFARKEDATAITLLLGVFYPICLLLCRC